MIDTNEMLKNMISDYFLNDYVKNVKNKDVIAAIKLIEVRDKVNKIILENLRSNFSTRVASY